MDDATERRIGRNEVAFRRVNESLEPTDAPDDATFKAVCECGVLGCTDRIELQRAEYEAIRSDFNRFLLVPGHELDVDDVLENHGTYLVVAKEGAAREVAASDDPRGDLLDA